MKKSILREEFAGLTEKQKENFVVKAHNVLDRLVDEVAASPANRDAASFLRETLEILHLIDGVYTSHLKQREARMRIAAALLGGATAAAAPVQINVNLKPPVPGSDDA